jgi:hypothetical protein
MPNKKYLMLQRTSRDAGPASGPPSPAQMQEMFAQFNAWKEKFKANILDMGGKLKAEVSWTDRSSKPRRSWAAT